MKINTKYKHSLCHMVMFLGETNLNDTTNVRYSTHYM